MKPVYRADESLSLAAPAPALLPPNLTKTSLATHRITHTNRNDGTIKARDVLSAEEREKKEMEWLVNTTQHFLFPLSSSSSNSGAPDNNKQEEAPSKPLSRSQSRRIHNLMKAWGIRRTAGAPYVVDQLFDHLRTNSALTIHSYNLRLEAWARSRDPKSISQCMEILNTLKEHQNLNPNVHSYTACIKVWIRNATPTSLEMAEALLSEMQAAYNKSHDTMMAPNRRLFNLLLYGLAHSNNTTAAAKRALEVFDYMVGNGDAFCQPNSNTLHQVIMCLSRNTEEKGYEDVLDDTFQKCLKLAEEKEVEIYADTFNVYMSGWLKSQRPTSLERIQTSLNRMEQIYQGGSTITAPNTATMNTILAAHVRFSGPNAVDLILSTRKRLQSKYLLTPDTITFNTLIDAHCKSRRAVADVAALSLLQVMERHLVKGKKLATPDSYSYCAVIDCLAKAKLRTAGTQSEQILHRMAELHLTHGGEKPSLAVYNAVLNAMAASSPVNITAVKALLTEMEKSDDNESSLAPKPSIVSYNTVLKAALRSRSVHGAEWADEILQSLELRATTENDSLRPDSFSYTTVIAAYGKCRYRDKAAKAAELVERAIQNYRQGCLGDKPGITVFNAACNACSFVIGDEEEKVNAFTTVVAISNLLTNYTKPDEITYGTLLRACSQLLKTTPTKQQTAARQIFEKACSDGCCSDFVLNQLRFAASPRTYRELLDYELGEPITQDDVPDSWCRNVKFR